jgi:hypothetical protein
MLPKVNCNTQHRRGLLQPRIVRLGFLQDGDVGVGVFPEGEEIFVVGERTDASFESPRANPPGGLDETRGFSLPVWVKGRRLHVLVVVARVILVVVLVALAALVFYALIYRNLKRDVGSTCAT